MKNNLSAEELAIVEAFAKKRVMHLKLRELIEEMSFIELPSYKGKVIVLVGPAGSGKSTALSYFFRLFNQEYWEEMKSDLSFVPAIQLAMPTGISGDFDWRDGFIRILEQFCEPLIRRKVIPKQQVELDGDVLTNIGGLVRSDLRRAVRNCVHHRRTKVMLLDEASSLFSSSSKDKYLLQFELLKSAANDFGLPMLLCGAYDLLKIQEFNGQLIRRTEIFHFSRYLPEDLFDGTEYGTSFHDAVASLLEAIPLQKEDGLVDHVEYFLMKTVGCIGNLKDWLTRALEEVTCPVFSDHANLG
ncbi:ATP-binding protein [Noviherbaspirillum agri]